MSAKRKKKWAKPKAVRSRDDQRRGVKQGAVKKRNNRGQREAVKMPPFDQLESIAARETPEIAGTWWIALQAAHHVIECAAKRDIHTGESLPRPLAEVLDKVACSIKTGTRPISNDRLHRAAVLAFEPLRAILHQPRTRLLREHAQRPIHAIREMDTHCMAWLARLPGRTIREKLAGKQHALSVVRRFTPDTPENRVVKRVADLLMRRLDGRFAHAVAYDEDGPCDAQQRETLDFCRRFLRDEGFGPIPLSDMPRPNNALLNDRHYARVWRAWMLLHEEEEALKAAWPHAEEIFRTAAFWAVAGEIAARYGARVAEELVVPDVGMADSHKCGIRKDKATPITEMYLLVTGDDASQADLEAAVISVRQVHEGIRIVENRLRPKKNSRGPAEGYVKLIKYDKNFGFIRGESGEEYYFDPKTVGDKGTFSDLSTGDRVTFTPIRQGTGKSVSACNMRRYETGLRVAHVIEKDSKTWRVAFHDAPEQSDFQCHRGFPVHATPDNGQRTTTKRFTSFSELKHIFDWRGCADIEGLRDFAKAATPSLNLKLSPSSDAERPSSAIGIDPFGRCVFVGTKEEAWSTATLPYALRHESQWQVGTSRRLPSVGEVWPLDADLSARNAADESTAIASCHQIVRALAQEVRGREVSFVVPDGPDEFSQQTLRPAMLGAFPRSRPIARSVAAALSWQHRGTVRDGDKVLVLCAEADALSFSLLVARRDRRLEERPESKGIFWERRPALPADEYGEGLGLRDIWRDYARRLFNLKDRDESDREKIISYLVDSGLLREAVESGAPRWIRDRDQWLVLEHSPQHWADVLGRWRKRFDSALKSGLRELISKAVGRRCHLLLVGPPFNERAVFGHIKNALSQQVGRVKLIVDKDSKRFGFIRCESGKEYYFNPQTVGDVETFASLRKGDSVTFTKGNQGEGDRAPAYNVRPNSHSLFFEQVAYIASEKGELASGAAEFTERSRAGLPAWKDWLPDLFLEIIRDGLYDEMEIMRDKAVDATLGALHREKVAEELVLPAGQTHYILPLVAGRANRRPVPIDLRLDSDHFPLQQDVRVWLELSYQYGVENGYEITLLPVEPQAAPFSVLKGKWVKSGGADEKPVPPVRPPVLRDADRSTTIADIQQRVRQLLSDKVKNREGTIRWLRHQLREQREKLEQAALGKRTGMTVLEYDHSDLLEEIGNSGLVDLLLEIVDNHDSLRVSQDSKKLKEELKKEALFLLCALGDQAPKTITERIRTKLKSGEPHLVPEHCANATGILHRAKPDECWLDQLWQKVVTHIEPYENPRLYGEAMRELAHTAWVLPDFLADFAQRNPDFVQKSFRIIERGVRDVVSKAAQAMEPDSETEIYGGHIRGFQACCELVLALLRLRDTPRVANPSRMSQLAKSIRRADCLLTHAGKKVRNSLYFELDQPEELARVSDLAYAAIYYLMGHETTNLVRRGETGDGRRKPVGIGPRACPKIQEGGDGRRERQKAKGRDP